MSAPPLAGFLIARLPFFYGWVILGCVCCASMARQGGAVATLSVFISPMTAEFGWSRTAISGAVSLGGVLAALISPWLGPFLDRGGARLVLCMAILATGLSTMALSLTGSLSVFYLLFCTARTNFAGPFDLGIHGAINNWFVARRALATSIATLGHNSGLVLLPLVAAVAMEHGGWRGGWLAVGATVLAVGFIPVFLLMVRRPEDVGLVPDRAAVPGDIARPSTAEPAFTRSEALRTRAFWLLALFTVLAYPVQAGVSLHQAPFLIERGLSPAIAAAAVSCFSLTAGLGTLCFGLVPRRVTMRARLAVVGVLLTIAMALLLRVASAQDAFLGTGMFGAGIGGLLVTLPITWADYFGRRSYGAIRGIALSAQVLAQATGPLLSGVLRDLTGGYEASLSCFAILSALSIVAALFARRP